MDKKEIGAATLYHGDCFEIMPELAGLRADAVITDPPYNCTCCDWDKQIDLEAFWSMSRKIVKRKTAFCVFCQMPFAARLYNSNTNSFRYEFIYKKPVVTGFLDARKKPLRAHEMIYVFCDDGLPAYNPQMGRGEKYRKMNGGYTPCYGKFKNGISDNPDGKRFPTTILDVKHENVFYTVTPEFSRHPNQKSVNVLAYLVKTYTNPGDLVFDPFMGSVSTGVAAIKCGRRFIGIEKERGYFETACKRIERAAHEISLLAEIPQPAGKNEKPIQAAL